MKNKKPHRKRKHVAKRRTVAHRLAWPVIEGIAACAAILGAPQALLKSVKKTGSKAFLTGNRVDTGILIPELFAALATKNILPPGISTPQDWLATEKAKREQIKRQADEHELMPVASALRQAGEAMGHTFSELERFARELPPGMAGGTAVEIGKRLSAEVEAVRKTLKQKFEMIPE